MQAARTDARTRLLDGALTAIREKGYSATSVDDLCRAAGATKGAFFHHFRSKEDLAVAAAAHFGAMAEALFRDAPYHDLDDPLERLLGYVAFRKAILDGALPDITCLLGTMVQETYATHPAIRDACSREINAHAATLEADIVAAQAATGRADDLPPASLALHTQAVLQGAFILAKATGDTVIAAQSLDHLHRYIEGLFRGPDARETPDARDD
jgi:TetR/AcrR family transcriptional regulator, transcriptional repressor for nem operon